MQRIITGIFVLLLAGCAANPDLKVFYEHYDAAFIDQHRPVEHRIPRDGHTLYAREYKTPGAVPEPPIILMHGFPDSLHLYDRLAPLLARERRTIAFDFLGWGKSDKPPEHRYDAASLRRDLEAVLGHFDLDRVVIVVHDASGLPGIDWVLDNPQRTETLVLLNTLYGPTPNRVMPPAIKRFSSSGPGRNLSVFGANRSDGQWQKGVSKQLREFAVDPAVQDTYTKLFAHQALGIRPAFFGLTGVWTDEVTQRGKRAPDLRHLPVPTKVIFGRGDPYLTSELAKEFDAMLPNSSLWLVDNAGHYVQLDQPEVVAQAILNE